MKKTFLSIALLLMSIAAEAQVATGPQPFGSFGGGPFDSINLGNLNVNFAIPITTKAGRGAGFYYILSYNSSVWFPTSVNGVMTWQPVSATNYGWTAQTNAGAFGYLSHTTAHGRCSGGGSYLAYANFVYHDTNGGTHAFVGADSGLACDGSSYADSGTTEDGTGLTLNLGTGTSLDGKITRADGSILTLPNVSTPSYADTNGNQITTDNTNFYDTLGATALTISGTAPSPVTYSFTNSSGTTSTVTANYTSYTIQTNFGCSGVAEYSATGSLITSLGLPDGTSYQFTYEQTPNQASGHVTGRIASVTLPTTGTISYSYPGANDGINCSDGTTMGLNRTLNPQVDSAGTWGYVRTANGPNWNTTITDPVTPIGNQTVLQFATFMNGFYEVDRQVYQGHSDTGTKLLEISRFYNGATTNTISAPVSSIDVYTQPTGAPSSAHKQIQYNTFGLPTQVSEWDYGATTATRITAITYANPGNGIVDRPSDITVTDANNNKFSETQINYDEGTLTSTSGTPAPHHDYTNYGSSFTQRGNPTTVKQWVSGTTYLATTNTYDDLGNLRSTTDPGGHQTTFDYTDSYNDGLNHSTLAFPTTITLPATSVMGAPWQSHTVYNKYYWPSAMLYQAKDQNSQITQYTYDNMWRTTNVTRPDGGQTNYQYTTYQNLPEINASVQTDSTHSTSTSTLSDGLGRPIRTEDNNGGEAAGSFNQVDTCYNSSGQVSFVPYAYQGSGFTASRRCSSSTYAGDSFVYDALGRTTSVTHSDNTSVLTAYNGRAVQVQDEGNGNGTTRVTHVYQQDGLGRTTTACELASSIFGIQTMGTCGLDLAGNSTGVTTTYTYDALDRVTQITQGSSLTPRKLAYDGLSHVIGEIIPEAANNACTGSDNNPYSVCYAYDSEGKLLTRKRVSANQSASCIGAANCALTTTTYYYDQMHRLYRTDYADALSQNTPTPNPVAFYDTPSNSGGVNGYNIGRMTSVALEDPTYSIAYLWTSFGYDQMGRVLVDEQGFHDASWVAYYVNYTYNLAGQVTSMNANNYFTLTNNYNVSGQTYSNSALRQVTSSLNDANHPNQLFSAAQYNAHGALIADSLGNGINESFSYDVRGRLLSASASKGTNTRYSLGGPGSGNVMTYTPNSSLAGANDSVNGNWTYSYDALNRIASANKSGGNNFSFDIDRNANRAHETPGAQLSFDASTNHVASGNGVTYDAAGNIINDGTCTYTYDAEYRITSVATCTTATYFYDALGRRARRSVGSSNYEEVYDLGGRVVAEVYSTGWGPGEVYAGGRHLANYSNGTTYFPLTDWLGSERVRSDVNGNSAGTCTANPYGDNYSCSASGTTRIGYAGMEYDSESGLNQTLFRYYNPRLGLWMTPDPAGMAAANGADPQSLNRYAYALNTPSNALDPSGLDVIPCNSAKAREYGCGGMPGKAGVILDGSFIPDDVAGLLIPDGSAIDCSLNPCGSQPVSGWGGDYIGFATPSYGMDGSVSYSFSINWNLDPVNAYKYAGLTSAALAEALGLPTQAGALGVTFDFGAGGANAGSLPVGGEGGGVHAAVLFRNSREAKCKGERLTEMPEKTLGGNKICEYSFTCEGDSGTFIGGANHAEIVRKCGSQYESYCPRTINVTATITIVDVLLVWEAHNMTGKRIDSCGP